MGNDTKSGSQPAKKLANNAPVSYSPPYNIKHWLLRSFCRINRAVILPRFLGFLSHMIRLQEYGMSDMVLRWGLFGNISNCISGPWDSKTPRAAGSYEICPSQSCASECSVAYGCFMITRFLCQHRSGIIAFLCLRCFWMICNKVRGGCLTSFVIITTNNSKNSIVIAKQVGVGYFIIHNEIWAFN